MNQSQFNEVYKIKHIFTTFTPAPPITSTFVQSARLDAQRGSEQDILDATFGT